MIEGEGFQPAYEFGFHVPTSCGYLALENEWQEDWAVR
jgi:fructosamine-3-kinase